MSNAKQVALSHIGLSLTHDFCNGLFGSNNFGCLGAVIQNIYDDTQIPAIVIEIKYKSGGTEYGYFDGNFYKWDTAAELVANWTK